MKKYCYGVDIGENTVKLGIFTTKGKVLKNGTSGPVTKELNNLTDFHAKVVMMYITMKKEILRRI